MTTLALIGGDVFALVLSLGGGAYWFLFRHAYWFGDIVSSFGPLLFLLPLAYALAELYPAVGMHPAEELRRLWISTSLVYLSLGTSVFIGGKELLYSRFIFLSSWALALFLVPLTRALLRHLFAARPWWGIPVVVLGAGYTGELVVRELRKYPGLGLKPVALLDDDSGKWGKDVEGVPVVGPLSLSEAYRKRGVAHAVVAMPGAGREKLLGVLDREVDLFPHLLLIPDLFGVASLYVSSRDLGGMLGLEIRRNLLLPGSKFFKRALDLSVSSLLLITLSPLFLLLALLVRASSPGPVFYGHIRIGQGGKRFRAWKFRTMVQDADRVLYEYLNNHPELRAEWERDHKLRDDPRVTPIGRFLRRTSLDELPQLWNVLKGEMSLVGPRPIVEAEVEKYGPLFSLYLKVRPGLTGLWQVSGRNDTGYGERVALDAYYVRNWSPWLDLYILARTPLVVLKGEGAY